MSRILIAGCGDIGSALGLRLHADGHEVWGLRRSPRKLPAGINSLQADLTVPRTLRALPHGLDAAIYIATPDAYDDAAYEAAYVRGVENLIAALQARGASVARLIFVSSTSVYGQSNGEWVDEESATDAETFSARRLLQAEGVVLALEAPALVVRFGGIYGAGRNRLIERVRNGRPCQESPPLFTNRIHRDDCVAVLGHLLSLREHRPVYLAVDNEPAPQCAVMDWLAGRLGVPAPPRVEPGANADDRRPSSKRCRNDLLLASGYRFLYPSYRDGYAAILDDSGRRG
jgi:nucleoside-diphosphate-sugar epimerase